MSIWVYLARRLFLVPLILLGLFTIVFFFSRVIPADPARAMAGEGAGEEHVENIRHEFNLDKPLFIQYVLYLSDTMHGNLGVSLHTWRPVLEDIRDRVPATVELAVLGMILALLVGVFLGVLSAVYRGTLIDTFATAGSVFGLSMAQFWLALMLQILLCLILRVLPLGGRVDPGVGARFITGFYILDSILTRNWGMFVSSLRHIVLPSMTLGITSLGLFARITRTSLLEELRSGYVRTARAVGCSEKSVIWQALRNALIPIVTVMGMQFGFLLGGTVVVETVFDWPGIGLYAAQSSLTFDYPAIIGVTLLYGSIRIAFNLLTDISYVILDPRIRYS